VDGVGSEFVSLSLRSMPDDEGRVGLSYQSLRLRHESSGVADGYFNTPATVNKTVMQPLPYTADISTIMCESHAQRLDEARISRSRPNRFACAAFSKESCMNFANANSARQEIRGSQLFKAAVP
jgi:hypothetical protein